MLKWIIVGCGLCVAYLFWRSLQGDQYPDIKDVDPDEEL